MIFSLSSKFGRIREAALRHAKRTKRFPHLPLAGLAANAKPPAAFRQCECPAWPSLPVVPPLLRQPLAATGAVASKKMSIHVLNDGNFHVVMASSPLVSWTEPTTQQATTPSPRSHVFSPSSCAFA
ncbi:MAG: hypothetical protein K2X38_20440 [Gemmataceae bacterium]|nr:hypothetical protein [Gemmataceae bacterium]